MAISKCHKLKFANVKILSVDVEYFSISIKVLRVYNHKHFLIRTSRILPKQFYNYDTCVCYTS